MKNSNSMLQKSHRKDHWNYFLNGFLLLDVLLKKEFSPCSNIWFAMHFFKTICILFNVYSFKSTQSGCCRLCRFNKQSSVEDKVLSIQEKNGHSCLFEFCKGQKCLILNI